MSNTVASMDKLNSVAMGHRPQAGVASKKSATVGNALEGLIGESTAMRLIRMEVAKASRHNLPVLLEGEPGTGKEVVARAIHESSQQRSGPWVPRNCASLKGELAEAKLFGSVPGSFTGATQRRQGWFEIANNGTLFADEIGELELSSQSLLLRVLETGDFVPVGGEQTLMSNARLISATNRDLQLEVTNGDFRNDLCNRLKVISIRTPALRERPEDLPLLANYLLRRSKVNQDGMITKFTPQALASLSNYNWPGNVRELRNVVDVAVINARENGDSVIIVDAIELPRTTTVTAATSESVSMELLAALKQDRIAGVKFLSGIKKGTPRVSASLQYLGDLVVKAIIQLEHTSPSTDNLVAKDLVLQTGLAATKPTKELPFLSHVRKALLENWAARREDK